MQSSRSTRTVRSSTQIRRSNGCSATNPKLVGEQPTIAVPDRCHADHFESIDQYLETGERRLDWNNIRLPAAHRDGHEVTLPVTFEEHS